MLIICTSERFILESLTNAWTWLYHRIVADWLATITAQLLRRAQKCPTFYFCNSCYGVIKIKNDFLILIIFSLIIFYHSVWLGFEIFGLRVQVYSQLVQFTVVRKGYDNHHCHNKPPDRKWGWSVDDVIPGKDGPEKLRILKKSQLRLDNWVEKLRLDHKGRQLSFLPLEQRVVFSNVEDVIEVLQISTDRDLRHHKMHRVLGWV